MGLVQSMNWHPLLSPNSPAVDPLLCYIWAWLRRLIMPSRKGKHVRTSVYSHLKQLRPNKLWGIFCICSLLQGNAQLRNGIKIWVFDGFRRFLVFSFGELIRYPISCRWEWQLIDTVEQNQTQSSLPTLSIVDYSGVTPSAMFFTLWSWNQQFT